MKEIVYKHLDLPKIPEHLLDWKNLSADFFNIEKDTRHPGGCRYNRISWTPLVHWVSNTLFGETSDVAVYHNIVTADQSGKHPIHTDMRRCATIQYMIDPGGEDVRTNFYQQRGQSLRRGWDPEYRGWHPDLKEKFKGKAITVDYDDVDLVDSVCMQKHNWYLFRSDVLHDVSNLYAPRIHIHVAFFEYNSWISQHLDQI